MALFELICIEFDLQNKPLTVIFLESEVLVDNIWVNFINFPSEPSCTYFLAKYLDGNIYIFL